MYFVIKTFGCKVNQYESGGISSSMRASGFEPLPFSDDLIKTDILIINSCTVTENSDRKVKQLLKSAKAQNTDILTVLIGCYPQAFPNDAKELGADIILGTVNKPLLAEIIKAKLKEKSDTEFNTKTLEKENDENIYEAEQYLYEEFKCGQAEDTSNTRVYLKIEDGCERFCSYCVIPKARGKVRSRELSEIKREARRFAEIGHKEIVLVGVNLSCYGQDKALNLCDAAEAAAEIEGIIRLRLSSLEPGFLDENIIKRLSGIKKLCPHFHLSLQSGCDATLSRMNRGYTAADYLRTVKNLRECFPDCSVTTDIMVGFAGETDEEFEETLNFVNLVGFSKIHVFTYSKRAGTPAAERTDHVLEKTKTERYERMKNTARELEKLFFKSQIGTVQKILVERSTGSNYIFGHTANYLPVRVYNESYARHEILAVRITEAGESFCVGVIE